MSESKKKQIVEKRNDDFQLHEIVFCKMRGYACFWPSRIVSIENEKVKVEFLGDMGRV